MTDPFALTDRVAIVTGASRGIGAAIAEALAGRGARVVLCSRNQQAVEAAAARLAASGGEALGIACHMGRPGEVAALVDTVAARYGRIDILVNNAATNPVYGPLSDLETAAFDKILDVNLKGPLALCQGVYPHMKAGGNGAIVNVSSVAGLKPEPGLGAYGMSKAALNMMTMALAREWTPDGIRVNAICPGFIKTTFSKALWTDEGMMHTLNHELPARRIGEPVDVAGLAVFLASDAARYCTGGLYTVDGGYTIV